MALPSSRSTTYVAGVSQVKSADLNTIQDMIVAAHAYTPLNAPGQIAAPAGLLAGNNQHVQVQGTGRHLHGSMEVLIPGTLFRGGYFASESRGAEAQLGYMYPALGGGGNYFAGIQLEVGKRILELRMRTDQVGAGTRTFRFRRTTLSSDAVTTIASDTNTGTGDQSIVLSGLTSVIASGSLYWVEYEATDEDDAIKGVVMTYDFPP